MVLTLLNAACTFANTSKTTEPADNAVGNAVADWMWNSTFPDTVSADTLSGALETARESAVSAASTNTASGNLVSLGVFKTTAYCPCNKCSEGWGRRTSSGTLATAGHTVATDPRVIPAGTRLLIDGVEYVAEDIGGGVKGNHIDIYYNTHAETRTHGVRNSEVFLIQ